MEKLPISSRVLNMQPSATLKMAQAARDLQAKGVKVISLSAGEPDFVTPKEIIEVAKASLDQGNTHYTSVRGCPKLLKALQKKFLRDQGVSYDIEQLMVTSGGKSAILLALEAILNPGDEAVMFAPYWVSYKQQTIYASGTPVEVKTTKDNNFMPTLKGLQKAVTDKTKVVILNSPSNPSGSVISKKNLEDVVGFIEEKNLYLISDEIYEKLLFRGQKHYSPVSMGEKIKEKTILINGMSKGFAMTGWRVGYAAGNKNIISAMLKLQGQSTSCLPQFIQDACTYALAENEELSLKLKKMNEEYQERADLAMSLVKDIPNLSALEPQGAFYLWLDVNFFIQSGRFVSDAHMAEKMLTEAHVATVCGEAFGMPGYLRASIASSKEDIKEAFRRVKGWLC